ncbi:MAG: alpha/beta fold hydrolase [Candidatus Binatia bacterium]
MQLHFQVQGNGHPLIILHGFLGSLDNWRTVGRRFSQAFRVFTVDLRNHGGSPHSDRMNYELMANDLLDFITQQKLSSVYILGHSMGGKVAMQLAIDDSQSVAKLIVVDIAPRAYDPSHRPLLNALRSLDLGNYKRFAEVDEALAPLIPPVAARQFLLKNLTRDRDRRLKWKIDLEAIARNYDDLAKEIAPRGYFIKPTLFIRGGRSNYITESDIPLIQRIFPAAHVETIGKAGHWVHADAPEEFLQVVTTFLAGN